MTLVDDRADWVGRVDQAELLDAHLFSFIEKVQQIADEWPLG